MGYEQAEWRCGRRVIMLTGRPRRAMNNTACQTPTAVLLIVLVLVIRRIFDGRRMAGWDAEWGATGPQWCDYR